MSKPASRILLAADSVNVTELTRIALTESGLIKQLAWVADGVAAVDFSYQRGRAGSRSEGHPAVWAVANQPPLGTSQLAKHDCAQNEDLA
jgi:hypothetical protein